MVFCAAWIDDKGNSLDRSFMRLEECDSFAREKIIGDGAFLALVAQVTPDNLDATTIAAYVNHGGILALHPRGLNHLAIFKQGHI